MSNIDRLFFFNIILFFIMLSVSFRFSSFYITFCVLNVILFDIINIFLHVSNNYVLYSNDNSNDNKIIIIKKKIINYVDAKYLLFFYQVVLYSFFFRFR